MLLFGEFIKESVAYPLPHRQYGFSLPKMLRIYSGFSVHNGKPIKRGDPAGGGAGDDGLERVAQYIVSQFVLRNRTTVWYKRTL